MAREARPGLGSSSGIGQGSRAQGHWSLLLQDRGQTVLLPPPPPPFPLGESQGRMLVKRK